MGRIVTFTLNPCIDLNLEVDQISFDTPLRAKTERKRAGGKGVNVSEALAILGVPSVAVAPLGGYSGQEFADLAARRLNPDLVELKAIPISQPTRTNTVISEPNGRHIKVNQQGPILSDIELQSIVDSLDELVARGGVLAICGSMTPGLDKAFYKTLVERYRSKGAFVALDADGEAFRLGLEAKPNLVKPNRQELSMWTGTCLDEDDAFRQAIANLVKETQGLCLATDGGGQAYLASPAKAWTAKPMPASGSPVGAGDCSLAGLLSALWQDGLLEEPGKDALKLALACGTASAGSKDTEGLKVAEVRRIYSTMEDPLELQLKFDNR